MCTKLTSLLAEKSSFGDKRLSKRFSLICHQFSNNLSGTIPESSGNRSKMKATYNFFDNDKVSVDKMIAAHVQVHQLNRDKVKEQVLLVAQDTTDLSYSTNRSRKSFGPMLRTKNRGCKLHNSLVISSSGIPLGLFKQSAVRWS